MQPGICYKLYTRQQESHMDKYSVPEILRVPLENISLTVKLMREHEDVKVMLDYCRYSQRLTMSIALFESRH